MSFPIKNSLITLIVLCFSVLSLQGCNFNQLESLVSQEKLNMAKERIEFILNTDYDSLNQSLVIETQKQMSPEVLRQIHDLIPDQTPLSINLVGYNSHSHSGGGSNPLTESFTFQYQYEHSWLLVSLSLQTQNEDESKILGFNFKPISGDLREINAFIFEGKPIQNYLILLLSVLVPVFIIYSLYLCYKTTAVKRKWLWYLFITFGFCSIQLEWTTGRWDIQPLMFQLLGSGFFRASMYAPVILKTSVPIGAIIFLFKRKKRLE
jgi:hypothetical protein